MVAQLRVFLVALEEGSLNRAAARLRMSQSALSRQMQALEHEIGGSLLERTTSGVRPTNAGLALAAAMPRVLADYDATIAEARRTARGQLDLVRIGYLGSAAQAFLDPALASLRHDHPEVKVKLLDLSPGEQIASLRRGEIDVAITGQEGGFAASEFYTKKLATLPIVAVLPADHRLASRKKILLKDLRGERFLSSPEEDLPGRDRWIVQLCRRVGFRPNFALPAESISQGFSLINSEGVIGILPAYVKNLPVSGVAMIEIGDPNTTWDFLIVWQRGRTAGSTRAVLDALSASVHQSCKAAEKNAKKRSTP